MNNNVDFTLQAFCKMAMHGMKHPHATCTGFLLSPTTDDNKDEDADIRIIEAIPVTHTSHYLAPNLEVAFNLVKAYADDQEMVISGYYHIDKELSDSLDVFAQRIGEKIGEQYANPLICLLSFENLTLHTHQYVDGKWRKKQASLVKVEDNAEQIIFNNEKLYRQIIDFDEHFDDISLDWTNQNIGQRIDSLSTSLC